MTMVRCWTRKAAPGREGFGGLQGMLSRGDVNVEFVCKVDSIKIYFFHFIVIFCFYIKATIVLRRTLFRDVFLCA